MPSSIGFGSVSLTDHTMVTHRDGDTCFYARSVSGWLTRLDQDDLAVSLVRDSRWALGVALAEGDTPFIIIPGCKVAAIQNHRHRLKRRPPIGYGAFDELANVFRVVHPDAAARDLPRMKKPDGEKKTP